MMTLRSLIVSLSLLFLAPTSWASVVGLVTDPMGAPVPDAVVTDLATGLFGVSGLEGQFQIDGVELPAELEIVCGGFRTRVEEFRAEAGGTLTVVLERQVGVFEQIFVSGERISDALAPDSVAATTIDPLAVSAAPRVIGEAIAEVPGLAENGQGGIFRTYSIRGVSRGRVTTLVAGARIVSERRAGASASFLDPVLVGSVETLRGPSSTYYGSGAIGGVVQLFPRRSQATRARLGFATEGHEHDESIGVGGSRFSLDAAHRAASNAETPDGRELHTGFRQGALVAQASGGEDGRSWDLQGIFTRGTDIRKSNTDFPTRVTVYPEENHTVLRGYYEPSARQSFELYLHDNDLETDVDRPDRVSSSLTEALDLGARWRAQSVRSDRLSLGYGVEYFGRRSVRGRESRIDLLDEGPVAVDEISLDDGEEDEIGLYGTVDHRTERGSLHVGVRWVGQRQGTAIAPTQSESELVGSIGLTRSLTDRLTLTSNLGLGTRFGSLTERYFNGTTARGVSIGNPDLTPERSRQVDLGLRWYGDRAFFTVSAFYHRISDYIERLEPMPDVQTTDNLVSGEIRGIDGEIAYRVSPRWSVSLGGHLMESEADDGGALADVPSNRLSLSTEGRIGSWNLRGRWQHRFAKGEVGPGERALEVANIVSVSGEVPIRESWSLSLSVANLTDEEYFPSADDKSDFAPRRSGAISIAWRRP